MEKFLMALFSLVFSKADIVVIVQINCLLSVGIIV